MDNVDRQTRSRVMAAVRSKGNRSTELALIEMFRQHHVIGWRRNKSLPGKPDFVWPKAKVALFVDGCFWHGCAQHCRIPATNRDYWINKVNGNKRRDKLITRQLRKNGWQVLRIWEHELKLSQQRIIGRIRKAIDAEIES